VPTEAFEQDRGVRPPRCRSACGCSVRGGRGLPAGVFTAGNQSHTRATAVPPKIAAFTDDRDRESTCRVAARVKRRRFFVGSLVQRFVNHMVDYRRGRAYASKHVRVLERAGLVHRTVRGRTHHCRLEPAPLADVQAWLTFYQRYWTRRLDALETMLRRHRAE
jgi:hypothetical protein